MIPYSFLQKTDGVQSINEIQKSILDNYIFEGRNTTITAIFNHFHTLTVTSIQNQSTRGEDFKYSYSNKEINDKNFVFFNVENRKLVTLIISIFCIQLIIDHDLSCNILLVRVNIFDKDFHYLMLSIGFLYGVFERGFNDVAEYFKKDKDQFELYYYILKAIKNKKLCEILTIEKNIKSDWFSNILAPSSKILTNHKDLTNQDRVNLLGNNIDVLVNQLKEVWITYRLSNDAKKSENCIDFDKLFKQEEVLGVKLSPTKNKEQKKSNNVEGNSNSKDKSKCNSKYKFIYDSSFESDSSKLVMDLKRKDNTSSSTNNKKIKHLQNDAFSSSSSSTSSSSSSSTSSSSSKSTSSSNSDSDLSSSDTTSKKNLVKTKE